MLDMIHYKKCPFTHFKEITLFREAFQDFLTLIKQSNPNLPSQLINMDFCISFKLVIGSMISTITRIYAGRSGFQILDAARELSFLQNIQASSSYHPASNSMKNTAFSVELKWPGQTV
jgi:hypothetical protein